MSDSNPVDIPRGNAAGFVANFKQDFTSGFFVFLIALPLCLGIAVASGFPPIAGIFTAIIGAIMTTFISNSELTIKGPAAGMIVIVFGCVSDFGGPSSPEAYQAALAVGVVAAACQIIFGLFRGGILSEFFPLSAVHGMLAAIGVIIIIKQIPVALGFENATGKPLEMVVQIPEYISGANPAIAAIGLVSIIIMFTWPVLSKKISALKKLPAPIVVLFAAIPMGMYFNLLQDHSYDFQSRTYQLGEQYLVDMPDRIFGMFDYITFPDFSVLSDPLAWKWIFMFFAIGSLESLLSAKAVDMIDPWKRKTNMNRDVVAVGSANLVASFVGGLPMISEIVRSRANIDNGARTRFSDMWHGIFLLLCVALIPTMLHLIPLAALAAMLIFTGTRLAHINEFKHMLEIGREQLLIFVVTLVAVLSTDLLMGIGIGIAVKICIHLFNGVPIGSFLLAKLDVEEVDANTVKVVAKHAAIFSNWISFRKKILSLGLEQNKNVILDLSDTKLVDHSVMDKLDGLKSDFKEADLSLTIVGLDSHKPLANHKHSARKRA
tara:strand:- start:1415 stop:3055 length:1641 start_codon:yes stop_codon:yes gene_type:complete